MTLKKINAWLHLWLGLDSGLIVFIVSITGCIYVFEKEIRSFYQPWQFVQPQEKSFLLPTQLIDRAKPELGKLKPTSINYGQKNEAATVNSLNRKKGTSLVIYMNPYTAEIIHIDRKNKRSNADFFRFILNGHRTLWMGKTGSKIIGAGVLVFVVLLISGIVLWWPKKWIRSIRDQSFKIKWSGSFKRVNYDLHKVAGFYVFLVLLLISLTGLVYSYKWYSKSLYWVTSGGKSLEAKPRPLSDTTTNAVFQQKNIDKIYSKLATTDQAAGMFITLPAKASDAIGFIVYLKAGTFYKADRYAFDQYTMKQFAGNSPLLGKYEDASIPDKIRRMNYDLHVGSVMGLPTKIIAFLASLISASLPVTGFLVWYGKKFKKKKEKKPLVQEKMILKKTTAPWKLKKIRTAAMQEPVV